MFLKLQSFNATVNSVNNSILRNQRNVEGIKVSDFHEDIQKAGSEVKHKILIELEKKNGDVKRSHLVAY